MRFCENCGNEIKDDDKFCVYCGNPISQQGRSSKYTSTSIYVKSLFLGMLVNPKVGSMELVKNNNKFFVTIATIILLLVNGILSLCNCSYMFKAINFCINPKKNETLFDINGNNEFMEFSDKMTFSLKKNIFFNTSFNVLIFIILIAFTMYLVSKLFTIENISFFNFYKASLASFIIILYFQVFSSIVIYLFYGFLKSLCLHIASGLMIIGVLIAILTLVNILREYIKIRDNCYLGCLIISILIIFTIYLSSTVVTAARSAFI